MILNSEYIYLYILGLGGILSLYRYIRNKRCGMSQYRLYGYTVTRAHLKNIEEEKEHNLICSKHVTSFIRRALKRNRWIQYSCVQFKAPLTETSCLMCLRSAIMHNLHFTDIFSVFKCEKIMEIFPFYCQKCTSLLLH